MEALAIKTLAPINSISCSLGTVEKREPRRSFEEDLQGCFSSVKFCGMPRRRLISGTIALSSAIMHVCPAISLPLQEAKDPEVIRYQKLNTGVKIQDIVEGEGPEAQEGDLVEVNYVCRRSNGYFVHSTVDQFSGESTPVILPLDGKENVMPMHRAKATIIGLLKASRVNEWVVTEKLGERTREQTEEQEQVTQEDSTAHWRESAYNETYYTTTMYDVLSVVNI